MDHAGTIAAAVTVIFGVLGFLGFSSIKNHLRQISIETAEAFETLSAALEDNTLTTEETKEIVQKFKDIASAFKTPKVKK
jgi:hypothetical protein